MASLSHHDAGTRSVGRRMVPAALLAVALVAACGGDRARPAAGADSTGPAVAIPDTATRTLPDTAVPDTSAEVSAAAPAAPAPAQAATPPKAKKVAAAPAGQPKRATPPLEQADSAKPAAPPAPAPAPAAAPAQAPAPAADAPLRDAYHQAPRDTVTPVVYNGWKQYSLNCARCHGEDVAGTTIAPHLIVSLKPDGPINTKELFVQVVCAGRPEKGMPAWCALGMEMDKITDIYEYVKGRSDAKISPGRPAVKQQG